MSGFPPNPTFFSPVSARMKQQDEKSCCQDLSYLAAAPHPPISPGSWGVWQQLAEEEAISEQANIAWRNSAESKQVLMLRKNLPSPLLLDLPFSLETVLCYQSSSKSLGEMAERPLKQLEMAFDTCFCKMWKTHFWHWMSSLGSALQHQARRPAASQYVDVVTTNGCYKIQNQPTLAICWARFKSLPLPKPSQKNRPMNTKLTALFNPTYNKGWRTAPNCSSAAFPGDHRTPSLWPQWAAPLFPPLCALPHTQTKDTTWDHTVPRITSPPPLWGEYCATSTLHDHGLASTLHPRT